MVPFVGECTLVVTADFFMLRTFRFAETRKSVAFAGRKIILIVRSSCLRTHTKREKQLSSGVFTQKSTVKVRYSS